MVPVPSIVSEPAPPLIKLESVKVPDPTLWMMTSEALAPTCPPLSVALPDPRNCSAPLASVSTFALAPMSVICPLLPVALIERELPERVVSAPALVQVSVPLLPSVV